jgi:hypothetical protein
MSQQFNRKSILSIKIITLFFVLISWSAQAASIGGTFYIDATNGSDTNSGLSDTQAWKSFTNINKSVLLAGTKVLLKKGCVWNQRLEIRGSGIRQNWIVVSAYGVEANKPKISLTNSKDDIAILISDIDKTSGSVRTQMNSFIEINGIEIANTRLGIYYRSVKNTENTGFTVRNVTFNNINCDEVMLACNQGTDGAAKNAEISRQLGLAKGNLIDQYGNTGAGGQNEYIFPAAIFVGGKTFSNQTVSGNHTTVLTEFKVENCEFNECIAGVMSVFYWPNISGTGANAWRQLINKVSIRNCTGTGAVNGMIAFDAVNGGAISNAEGLMLADADGWGVLDNVRVTRGSAVAGRTWPNGTTGLIFSSVQNFLVDKCEFSGILNQNNPDGCGFDFETNTKNVTVQRCKFTNNDGHAMLLMNGGNFGGNTNIIIQNNLFANNLRNSESDFEMYFSRNEDGHSNVKIKNNIAIIPKLNKKSQALGFINPTRTYIQDTDNEVYYLDETAQAITVTFGGETYTYKAKPNNVIAPLISIVEIENSELFISSTTISLKPTITKAVASYYKISESANFENADWKPFTTPIPFVVSASDGVKTVYLRVKNPIGESNIGSTSIILKKAPEKLDASTRQHIQVSPIPIIAKAKISLINSEKATTLNAVNSQILNLTVHDFSGKTVYHKLVNTFNNEVDFSDFQAGLYVVSFRNETTNLNTKVLKQ